MDLGLIVQFRIVMSGDELRVLSKALRGQLSDAEAPAALALQEKIMLERARQMRNLVAEYDKTEAAIARAGAQMDPKP